MADRNRPRRSLHGALFLCVTLILVAPLVVGGRAAPAPAVLTIDTKMAPPAWAVLERRVLEASAPAVTEFYKKYYDDRGYVQCVLRWGARGISRGGPMKALLNAPSAPGPLRAASPVVS